MIMKVISYLFLLKKKNVEAFLIVCDSVHVKNPEVARWTMFSHFLIIFNNASKDCVAL